MPVAPLGCGTTEVSTRVMDASPFSCWGEDKDGTLITLPQGYLGTCLVTLPHLCQYLTRCFIINKCICHAQWLAPWD